MFVHKKIMRFCWLPLLGVILMSCFLSSIARASDTAVTATPLDSVLTSYLEKYSMPALSAAVVKNGVMVAVGAVGVRKAGTDIPVTIHDPFHIGSDTKAMTALLAATFVEEGKLRWDSTLAEVFPEFVDNMAPKVGDVTLQQLLSHTSGMPLDNERFGELLAQSYGQDGNLDEMRQWLVSQWMAEPLANEPGKVFVYSNMGYTTVGAMIERVAGKDYETLLFERVFTPLGFESAGFGPQSSSGRVDAPLGHLIVDDTMMIFSAGPNGDNPLIIGPAGTAHMSVIDFATWAGWNAGEGKRGPALVSPDTLKKLHTPVIEMVRPNAKPGTPVSGKYALGWGMMQPSWCQEEIITHTGSNTKNLATIYLLPAHDFAMVMMTNVGGELADAGLKALAEELYKTYGPGK